MPVQTWTPGQILSATEMKTITDIIPFYLGVSASTNPCVAGTFYDVDASGAAKTMTVPVTAGAIFGFRAKSIAGGVVTITAASGVILGPGCGSSGSASMTLGAQDAYVVLASNGTNLYVIGGAFDTGWVNVTAISNAFTNGYSAASTISLRKQGDVVRARGQLTAGGASANLGAWTFTTPALWSPTQDTTIAVGIGTTAVNNVAAKAVGTGTFVGTNNSVTFLLDGLTWTID